MNTVWSEIPAIQVASVRVLKSLEDDQPWAREVLEQVFLEPEIETWVGQ